MSLNDITPIDHDIFRKGLLHVKIEQYIRYRGRCVNRVTYRTLPCLKKRRKKIVPCPGQSIVTKSTMILISIQHEGIPVVYLMKEKKN